MFNKFFDCLNVRCQEECVKRRKPDVRPFRSVTDPRIAVSYVYHIYFIKLLNYYSGSNMIFLATLTSGKPKCNKEIAPQVKKIVCVSPKKRWKVSVSQVITILVYASYLCLQEYIDVLSYVYYSTDTCKITADSIIL